jgi:glycosyltransferase involved in cell wall biosynthesis
MTVYVAGYQAISILHGGPNTQIRNTAKYLGRHGISTKFFDAWRPFNRDECDIFHVFGANIGTYHLAREICALGVPLVVSPIVYSLHSPLFIANALRAMRLVRKVGRGIWSDYVFTADICRWADRVFANTRAEADLLSEAFSVSREKILVVPNGVDERFHDVSPALFRKTYGLEGFILNVGHTGHGRKNVLALIKALAQINHPAVIIGRIIRNEYGDSCRREAAKHKHILLIDGLENSSELLGSAYAACDVFVLPSLFETPGIAALEAALAGAKIVITKFGGTREYFGEMAKYVDPKSVSSIRDGIKEALVMKKDEALREHIRKEFLWQNVAEKTAAGYHALLATKAKKDRGG